MYPSTVSAWNTLRSKVPPLADFNRNFFRDLKKTALSVDLAAPAPVRPPEFAYSRDEDRYDPHYGVYAYRGGLPGLPGDNAVLPPDKFGEAVSELDIRFGGEASGARARLFLVDKNLADADLAAFMRCMPDGTRAAVYAYDGVSVDEILPFTRLDAENSPFICDLLAEKDAEKNSEKNAPLFDFLRDAIVKLKSYIDDGHVLLGDIFLITNQPYRTGLKNSAASIDDIVRLARGNFVPIYVNTYFMSRDMNYKELARQTGGVYANANANANAFGEQRPFLTLEPWKNSLQTIFHTVYDGKTALGEGGSLYSFYVDPSLRRIACLARRIWSGEPRVFPDFPGVPGTKVVLTTPSGKRIPVLSRDMGGEDCLDGAGIAHIPLGPDEAGLWRLEILDGSGPAPVLDIQIVGEAQVKNPQEAITHFIDVPGDAVSLSGLPEDKSVMIRCKTFLGENLLTGLDVSVTAASSSGLQNVAVNDDGTGQDQVAGDGVYTGVLPCGKAMESGDSGEYLLTSTVGNAGGAARIARDNRPYMEKNEKNIGEEGGHSEGGAPEESTFTGNFTRVALGCIDVAP
jgi:hypothetical protein